MLEYSDNYSMKSESFWNYYRDNVGNVNDIASNGKLFNYRQK